MMNQKVFFQRIMKTVLFVGIMGVLFYFGEALAQTSTSSTGSDSVFLRAYNTLYTTFTQARAVVYVTAGVGLIGMAVAFIFGKMAFRWLAMIAVALFTLAMAEKIVGYAVGAGQKIPESSFSGEVGDAGFKIYVGSGAATDFDYNALKHSDKTGLDGKPY